MFNIFTFSFNKYKNTGSVQTFTTPSNSGYRIECWGAAGAPKSNHEEAAGGAYVFGKINLIANLVFYIHVGQKGENGFSDPSGSSSYDKAKSGTYNGGGGFVKPWRDKNNSTGGGATDVRTTNGSWDNFNSLKARIIVAAGAGSCIAGSPLSYGGGLASVTYNNTYSGGGNTNAASAATQTSGYKFGIGQYGDRAGAGGGYYGGCAGTNLGEDITGLRGAGGSSFISGHTGCNAISESSTSSNIIHTGQPNHYSGYVFTNTVMKAGNELMPSPTGGTETGHSGNGYCKITWHPSL